MRALIKLVILVAVLYFAWTLSRPWRERLGSSADESAGGGTSPCVSAAMAASDAWGSGIGRFVNPPVDREAWSSFRSDIDGRISSAQSECGCFDDSCATARQALSELSSLVSDLDSSVQSGSPPDNDLAQRQESVDRAIEHAGDLARKAE